MILENKLLWRLSLKPFSSGTQPVYWSVKACNCVSLGVSKQQRIVCCEMILLFKAKSLVKGLCLHQNCVDTPAEGEILVRVHGWYSTGICNESTAISKQTKVVLVLDKKYCKLCDVTYFKLNE